jgi:hypothetical protein
MLARQLVDVTIIESSRKRPAPEVALVAKHRMHRPAILSFAAAVFTAGQINSLADCLRRFTAPPNSLFSI